MKDPCILVELFWRHLYSFDYSICQILPKDVPNKHVQDLLLKFPFNSKKILKRHLRVVKLTELSLKWWSLGFSSHQLFALEKFLQCLSANQYTDSTLSLL